MRSPVFVLCILPEVPKNELPDPFEWDRRFWETGYNMGRRGWCSPRFIRGCLDLIISDRDPFSFIQGFEEPILKEVDCVGCFFVKCRALMAADRAPPK